MNSQSTSRNHRTKGSKAKQALKSAIILALCIWLLYQYKNSHDTTKDKRINVHIKAGMESSATIMGRQGNGARYSSGSYPNSKDVDSVGDQSDEEDQNRESFMSDKEKQDQKDNETQTEKPESNEDNNPGIALRLNKDLKHGDQRLRVNEERDSNESQKVEEGRSWTSMQQKDETYKEDIKHNHVEETGKGEIEDGFHRFQDENGIPEDVDHILETMPRESSADKKSDLLHESRNRTIDSMHQGGRKMMSRTSANMPRGGRKLMARASTDFPRGGWKKLHV